jgi:hypothetical protein
MRYRAFDTPRYTYWPHPPAQITHHPSAWGSEAKLYRFNEPCYLLTLPLCAGFLRAQETQIQYLSGKGPKDAAQWGFYVTGGRRSGTWTTIAVPSNWEQQGFGAYNYGQETAKSNEHGLYRLRFPARATGKAAAFAWCSKA